MRGRSAPETAISTESGENCVKIRDNVALPKATKFRLAVYKLIESNRISVQKCNMFDNFDQLNVLPRRSASTSYIMLGKLKVPRTLAKGRIKTDISVKLAFASKDPSINNSLAVERKIYEAVTNPLIVNGHTPHVTTYYATLSCDNFLQELRQSAAIDKNADAVLADLQSNSKTARQVREKYDVNRMRALITERSQGVDFAHLLSASAERAADSPAKQQSEFHNVFKPVLFQILYTLTVFQEVGLQHNDLHAGNVFVDELATPIEYSYRVDADTYRLKTRLMARLYDFDRASKVATTYSDCSVDNTFLVSDACGRQGQCPKLDAKADLFRLVAFLDMFNEFSEQRGSPDTVNKPLRHFLEYIAPRELLDTPVYWEHGQSQAVKRKWRKAIAWHGALCYCQAANCEICKLRSDKRIKTPREVLRSVYFDEYRQSKPAGNANATTWVTPSSAVQKK